MNGNLRLTNRGRCACAWGVASASSEQSRTEEHPKGRSAVLPSNALLSYCTSSLLSRCPAFPSSLSCYNFDSYLTWRMEIIPKDAHRLLLPKSANDPYLPGTASLSQWTQRGPGPPPGGGGASHLCSLLCDVVSGSLSSS